MPFPIVCRARAIVRSVRSRSRFSNVACSAAAKNGAPMTRTTATATTSDAGVNGVESTSDKRDQAITVHAGCSRCTVVVATRHDPAARPLQYGPEHRREDSAGA
jgi:hypothetical protein